MSTDTTAAHPSASRSGQSSDSDLTGQSGAVVPAADITPPPAAVSATQVADYLRQHPDFFLAHDDLLVELQLPHESGKAISLLERQVAILRSRGTDARTKLNNLLDNARNNDQLFETTRDLVLALLKARDASEILTVAQDRLSHHDNIDACEIVVVADSGLRTADSIRAEPLSRLQQDFNDVFRLKRTHCGKLPKDKVALLFPAGKSLVKSTAVCPVLHNGQVLALLALGNRQDNYFNINLDTLFLDFIGNVIGAVLGRTLASAR
ncbi:MAG: hypothetical protein RLZZ385_2612 [Pseudomonadota bacterium]|jgi:uncharacterized protein YigA (DUF484 family)